MSDRALSASKCRFTRYQRTPRLAPTWWAFDGLCHSSAYPPTLHIASFPGTIKRKKSENLNPNRLLEAFQDPEDPYRVVAFFVNTTWDTSICPTNNITFMDSRELYRCSRCT